MIEEDVKFQGTLAIPLLLSPCLSLLSHTLWFAANLVWLLPLAFSHVPPHLQDASAKEDLADLEPVLEETSVLAIDKEKESLAIDKEEESMVEVVEEQNSAAADYERLRAENEMLKAENAALRDSRDEHNLQTTALQSEPKQQTVDEKSVKQQEGPVAISVSREYEMAEIPPRPHTTDPGAWHNSGEFPPPAGGSLESIMQWRGTHGRSALSSAGDSSDHGPPRMRCRSWLSKTPLSNKPNPVTLLHPLCAPACPARLRALL